MVLANDDYVKWDEIENPRAIDWENLTDMDLNFRPKEWHAVRLSERKAEIEILIQSVRDNDNNYEVYGKFYDDGNWYLLYVSFFKERETAEIKFTPYPISMATPYDLPYLERCRQKQNGQNEKPAVPLQ